MHLRLLLAILLVCAASYASISGLSLSSTVDQGGTTDMTAKMQFDTNPGQPVSFYINGNVGSVTAYDASGLILPTTQEESGNYTVISVTVPTDYVELDIQTSSLTSKSGSEWRYDAAVLVSENVSNFSSVLQLPPDAELSSTNGAVEGDNSGLALYWSAPGFGTSDQVSMRASYSLGQEASIDWQYLIVLVVIIVAAVATYLYLSRRAPQKPAPVAQSAPKQEDVTKLESDPVFRTLDENDKEIVREIVRQGGKTTQAHIYLYTHIPKATLSRRLASLESKDIVVRSQKGNRNLVTLGKTLGK
jgi:uncharacterized membrane protein